MTRDSTTYHKLHTENLFCSPSLYQPIMPGEEVLLEKEFKRLEEDWNSYKKSMPRHGRCGRSCSVTTHIAESFSDDEVCGLHLLSNSPKKLLSSLQDPSGDSCAASSAPAGRIQGRNLLEDLESAKDDTSPKSKDEKSSACSSVLVDQEGDREATESLSSSSCSWAPVWYSSLTSSCSCSCSSLASLSGDEEEEVLSAGRESRRGRWTMRMIKTCFGIMLLTKVLAVIVMMFAEDEYGDYMVPT